MDKDAYCICAVKGFSSKRELDAGVEGKVSCGERDSL